MHRDTAYSHLLCAYTYILQHKHKAGGTKDPRFATRLAAFSRWWGGAGKGSVCRAKFLQREVSAALSAERLRRSAAAAGVTLAVGDFVTVESVTAADDGSVSSGSTASVARTASRKTLINRNSSVSVASSSSQSTTTTTAAATAATVAAAAATGTTAESRLRAFRIWYASGSYTDPKRYSSSNGYNSSDEIFLESSAPTENIPQTGLYKAALQRRTARLADRTVRKKNIEFVCMHCIAKLNVMQECVDSCNWFCHHC
jgi:hypothetical protein